MSLAQQLNVSFADLMPVKGGAVRVRGDAAPYRISERLHAALMQKANEDMVPLSRLLVALRAELNNTN